jgi:hypothetical protein
LVSVADGSEKAIRSADMRRGIVQFICLWAVVLSTASLAFGVEFAGGMGTPADPYQIASAEHLISIGSDPNLLDKHFLMISDIDLDPNLSAACAFHQAVIGGSFRGVFDGGGFSVRHLTIRGLAGSTTGDWLGLFYRIEEYAEVRRVVLEHVDIFGSPDNGYVGALCSVNYGTLRQCFVDGTVSGGGPTGGLVGWNHANGAVQECGSICAVSGTYAGGLIGYNSGRVEDSHASGAVSGTQCGGLLAEAGYGSRISRCYASGRIVSTGIHSGGLVGGTYQETIADSYFLLASRDGGGPDNGFGTPLTSTEMKEVSSFTGWEFWGIGNNGFRVPWSMPEDGYPELTWLALVPVPGIHGLPFDEASDALADAGVQTYSITYDYDPAVEYGHAIMARPDSGAPAGRAAGILVSLGSYDWSANSGKGEPDDPYLILSPGQLECLALQPQLWNKCFALISDMDMAWRVHKRPLLGAGEPFDGVFDGDGHVIGDLTFETGGPDGNWSDMLGFFGEIGPLGSIVNLGLRDVSIRGETGKEEIGGMLCGINGGHVARCYAIGEVVANGMLAGLAGENTGVIEDCYVQGTIWDLIGRPALLHEAGLVGENTGTIRTCYSTCAVPKHRGEGLVAYNEGGSVESCLWDVEASGVQTSVGGTGVSTEELMDVSTLQSHGWGGNPNWVIDNGNDYPRLVWEQTPGIPIPASESMAVRGITRGHTDDLCASSENLAWEVDRRL